MRFVVFFLFLSVSPLVFSEEGGQKSHTEFEREIRQVVDPLVDQRLISGYFLSIHRFGEPILEISNGSADDELSLAPGQDVLYAVASMTKPVTALAIVQLIDKGRLSLEDPLSKYIPQFENMLVAEGGSYDSQLEPARSPILIKHLLTHTSGLTYSSTITGVGDVANAYKDLGLFTADSSSAEVDLKTQLDRLAELPLVAHPGTSYNYSVSYDVLTFVIEEVSGESFDRYMSKNIFEPLRMSDSHFFLPQEKLDRLSRLYAPLTRTFQIPGTPKMYQKSDFIEKGAKNYGENARFPTGGASLLTTGRDYQKFVSFLMRPNEFPAVDISRDAIALMLNDQVASGFGYNLMVDAMGPQAGNRTMSYGLGLKYQENSEGSPDYDYHFWGGAFNTRFWFDIETGISGVFLTQLFPTRYDVTGRLDEVADKFFSD